MDANGIATVLTALATLVTAVGWAFSQRKVSTKVDQVHQAAEKAAEIADVVNGGLPAIVRREVGAALAAHAAALDAQEARRTVTRPQPPQSR